MRFIFTFVVLTALPGPAGADVSPELRRQIADETTLLHRHFDEVLAELRAADTSDLSLSQKSARAAAIERLREYQARQVFPRNRDFAIPTPYFVDAEGTRCAMAHLIEQSGERELVARVARTANNAYIAELIRDPALVAWLDTNGLTAAEAARIQPGYSYPDCDPPCRDDEYCIYDDSIKVCTKACNPSDPDACGPESACEMPLWDPACFPPVLAEGPRPEPEDCRVSHPSSLGLIIIALGLAALRRRVSRTGRRWPARGIRH